MKKPNAQQYNSSLYFEEAVEKKGWWQSHRFLILRRICQCLIIILFALPMTSLSPEIISQFQEISPDLTEMAWEKLNTEQDSSNGKVWILKGTLANSEVLSTIPLGDPFIFLQSLSAGNLYALSGLLGVLIITIFYMIVGGRTYCSYVCPINIITDCAAWIRRQLKLTNQFSLSKRARFYILGLVLLISALFQVIAWELINPITGIFRGIVFGGFTLTNLAVVFGISIFILDIIGSANFWCGHVCPVGAFYSVLGKKTLCYIKASNIDQCDDCMDCYKVCPEAHILKPLIKDKEQYIEQAIIPVIQSSDCTRCGRCIDVCPEQVFRYGVSIKHSKIIKNKPKVKVS